MSCLARKVVRAGLHHRSRRRERVFQARWFRKPRRTPIFHPSEARSVAEDARYLVWARLEPLLEGWEYLSHREYYPLPRQRLPKLFRGIPESVHHCTLEDL